MGLGGADEARAAWTKPSKRVVVLPWSDRREEPEQQRWPRSNGVAYKHLGG